MNYTFLHSSPFNLTPHIIMTTNAQSLKTRNLLSNPHVSILVHDWVSHRPPTSATAAGSGRSGSPPAAATSSSLATLLLNWNTAALSSISTTITGVARFVDRGSEEEKWCKETHLANNTFGDQAREEAGLFSGRAPNADTLEGNSNSSCYIEGDEVRVVVVQVKEGRIADWKGGVKDWVVITGEQWEREMKNSDGRGRTEGHGLVNSIPG